MSETMKDAQQQPWEVLASPGHVLWEQVRVLYKHAFWPSLVCGLLGVVAVFVALNASSEVQARASRAAAWAVDKLAPAPDAPEVVALGVDPQPSWPALSADVVAAMATPAASAEWLQAQLAAVERGSLPDGCNTSIKITDSWPADSVGCRKSSDGKRVWIWGLAKREAGDRVEVSPALVVYRRAAWAPGEKEAWRLVSITASRVVALPGLEAVPAANVRRALGADFAELAR